MRERLKTSEIRRELETLQGQLAAQLGLREEARIEHSSDVMDQIQSAEAREFALQNLDRYARQLREVEFALQRIDEGDYGVCLDCEEEIGPKRLQAIPWAERCVRCQEKADRRESADDSMRKLRPLSYAA
jgi:DnaK suppressor protein